MDVVKASALIKHAYTRKTEYTARSFFAPPTIHVPKCIGEGGFLVHFVGGKIGVGVCSKCVWKQMVMYVGESLHSAVNG